MMSLNVFMNVKQSKNVVLDQKHFCPSISTSPGSYGVGAIWHKFVLAKQHKTSNVQHTI